MIKQRSKHTASYQTINLWVCVYLYKLVVSLGKTLIKIWNANDSSNGVQILIKMIYEKQMNNKVCTI